MRLVPIVLVLVTATAPARARAMCASAHSFLSPPSGAVVPPDPVLWLFSYEGGLLRADSGGSDSAGAIPSIEVVDGDGRALEFSLELAAWTPAFYAWRLAVATGKAGKVTVRKVTNCDVTYTVDPAWKAPAATLDTVRASTRESRWTCSMNATLDLEFAGGAPAYRLEWAATEEALRSGPVKATILPFTLTKLAFWYDRKEVRFPAEATLPLGHVDCTGTTFAWPDGAVFGRLVALHLDGSESEPSPSLPWEPPKTAPMTATERLDVIGPMKWGEVRRLSAPARRSAPASPPPASRPAPRVP